MVEVGVILQVPDKWPVSLHTKHLAYLKPPAHDGTRIDQKEIKTMQSRCRRLTVFLGLRALPQRVPTLAAVEAVRGRVLLFTVLQSDRISLGAICSPTQVLVVSRHERMDIHGPSHPVLRAIVGHGGITYPSGCVLFCGTQSISEWKK